MVAKQFVTRLEVAHLILTSDTAVRRAICRLALNQVEFERQRHISFYRNFRGFNKQDAGRFTRMAEKVWAGGQLTAEEIEFARPRMVKYSKQLARHANRRRIDQQLTLN